METETKTGTKPKTKNTVEEVLKIFENGWNKQVILYGPPGTSKTYSATEIAAIFLAKHDKEDNDGAQKVIAAWDKELKKQNSSEGDDSTADTAESNFHALCEKYLENNNKHKVIQFHPSYSYEDFVRGLEVKTEENGGIPSYEVKRKIIEEFGKGATNETPKVLIIDEINRAPLGSVLGELIYGLEYRGKAVSTPYPYKENGEDVPLKIAEGLFIIGTMNTADRSIGTMDYAVRRRFAFVPVLPNPAVIKGTWKDTDVGRKALNLFNSLMNEEEGIFANDMLEDDSICVEDIKIGHTYFLGKGDLKVEQELDYLKYRIEYQIRPVYEEYVKDGIIKKEGIDRFDDIVNKVLNPKKNTATDA